MSHDALSIARATIHSLGLIACFVVETCKWVAVVGCFCALAFAFICFGFKLERASANYAKAESNKALQALYDSTNWTAKIQNEYRLRLKAEEKLRLVCKKSKRACL